MFRRKQVYSGLAFAGRIFTALFVLGFVNWMAILSHQFTDCGWWIAFGGVIAGLMQVHNWLLSVSSGRKVSIKK